MNNAKEVRHEAKVRVQQGLAARYRAERRFQFYGKLAIGMGLLFLSLLFFSIISKGLPAFQQTYMELEIHFDPDYIDPQGDGSLASLGDGNYGGLVKHTLRERFPGVTNRREKRALYGIVSTGAAYQLRDMVLADPQLLGTTARVWVPADDELDMLIKGHTTDIEREAGRGILSLVGSDDELRLLSTSNDFTQILQDVKQTVGRSADQSERKLRRLQDNLSDAEQSLVDLEERMLDARNAPQQNAGLIQALDDRLADTRATIDTYREMITQEEATLSDLRRRADNLGGAERLTNEMPSYLVAVNGGLIKLTTISNTQARGEVLSPLQSMQDAAQNGWEILLVETPETARRLKDNALAWTLELQRQDQIEKRFNTTFFTAGDSREPELAGIWGAAVGSFYTLVVTLLLSFPIGVAAAVYLEEYAPKNRWTDLIEVNINNLAAVPSIVFGLLGLAVFINFFGLPRSAPLVGGLVLTLMTLPTIIIASRAALKSVPPSIREAALGVGASRIQMMTHHVLPLALPGMLTGTIIGMAQALGETAPLLMIGMVAFIVDIPGGFTDPAAVLPVQIYLWADSPERAFVERTSAAIMVLLGFLIMMNLLAVMLRKKFERRW
jgi:phosphate transport system permease protein